MCKQKLQLKIKLFLKFKLLDDFINILSLLTAVLFLEKLDNENNCTLKLLVS